MLFRRNQRRRAACTGGTPVSRGESSPARVQVGSLLLAILPNLAVAASIPASQGEPATDTVNHDAAWVGVVLICVVGLVLMAALVGPLVRANRFEAAEADDQQP